AIPAIRVRITQNGNAVDPLGPLGRRLRDAIVNGAEILIDLDRLESGWRRVLQILDNPHPPAVVEADADRLAHVRLGCHELYLKPFGHLEPLERLIRLRRLRLGTTPKNQHYCQPKAHAGAEENRVQGRSPGRVETGAGYRQS